jgi:polysaccharide export outer membrane protein
MRIVNLRFLMLVAVFFAQPVLSAGGFILGQGDVVRVTVYQHPDLSSVMRVNQNGSISFPLLGKVEVAGMSPGEVESSIAQRLEEAGFVKSAQVSLIIEEYHSQQVSVLGQVRSPGKYPIESGNGVIDMLAKAGGTKDDAADRVSMIKHQDGKVEQLEVDLIRILHKGDLGHDVEVGHGDIIYVPRMDVFYMYGAVQKPGAFRLEQGMNVMKALAVAGGLTARGSDKGITINRRGEDGSSEIVEVVLTGTLKPNDVVYVKESLF